MTPRRLAEAAEAKVLRLLGLAMRAGALASGFDAAAAALDRGEVRLLLLAEETGASSKKKILRRAEEAGCPVYLIRDAEALARVTGAGRRSIVGVKDKNFAAGMCKAADEGAVRPM